jgi:hypothetical protein
MNYPILTEPGVKYWMSQSLKECRNFKDKNINFFYNIGMTILLVLGITIFLIFSYKGNITQVEINEKNKIKQEYIVSKLQQLALIKKQKSNEMITNLPTWDDHPELDLLNRKLYV